MHIACVCVFTHIGIREITCYENSTKSIPHILVYHREILHFVIITTKETPDLISLLGSFVSSGSEQNDKYKKRMTSGGQNMTFSIDSDLEDVA